MSADPTTATATELAAAIAAGELSSEECLDALLARIDAVNPTINAVVALDADRARALCRTADSLTTRGRSLGPLHGVPITVKDVWETEGLVTTAGAVELREHVPLTDALAVGRLKAAGAVVFGKTNTPLWAGDDQTYNEVYGLTRNPWDPSRTASGSSGGAAAALAAGCTPLELGSDIGGSIRTPAHACGVYGLKPSWGLVPSRGHIPYRPGTLIENDVNCGGPMARSVADLRLGLDVIAGPLPDDAVAWHLDLPSGPAHGAWDPAAAEPGSLAGLRVAAVFDDARFGVATAVRERLRAFADKLAAAGARVEEAPLPVPLIDAFRSWQDLVLPQIGAMLPDETFEAFTGFADLVPGDDIGLGAARGLALRWRDVNAAEQRRQEQRRAWAAHFEHHDVVLVPPMATPAFPHDIDRTFAERVVDIDGRAVPHLDMTAWPGGIGVMLLPVVVLPTGRTPDGLPVGAALVGPWLRDRWLLDVAGAVDAVAGDFAMAPI